MNTPSRLIHGRGVGNVVPRSQRRSSSGFTLVEMLVVITIIGILAGLITEAAIVARRRAKIAVVSMELKAGLEHACMQYKEKFGEYPPDFAGLQNTQTDPATSSLATPLTYRDEARATVLRHMATAFPRYVPGVPSNTTTGTQWDKFRADVQQFWKIDVDGLSPTTALIFWLGGSPEWFLDSSNNQITPTNGSLDKNKPVKSLQGFSADVTNPFSASASRIPSFFEFDIASLGWISGGGLAELAYWPKAIAVTDKTWGPIVYFRAENGNYTVNGAIPPNAATTTTGTNANVKNESSGVWPAVDTRLSNFDGKDGYDSNKAIGYTWINPQSFQIFSSGLDQRYATPRAIVGGTLANVDVTMYPTGESYQKIDPVNGGSSYDDITNFSSGTLENSMP
jgi:prepilin-type N-terminal cleavage/methylation domain-containing protein